MFIIDDPYVSHDVIDYLEQTQTPVLANDRARVEAEHADLHLVPGPSSPQERIVTLSENPLPWVMNNVSNDHLLEEIRVMKDKAALRRALKPLYPDFFFDEVSFEQLETYPVDTLKLPVVLKPAVGFKSFGVYTIETPEDWDESLKTLKSEYLAWREMWSVEVVDASMFVIEEMAQGDEYAVDVYYDAQGTPVICDIFKHEFSGPRDVSDRLYCTSKAIIEENLDHFTDYFTQVNEYLGLHDFCTHVEFRMRDGVIVPIEFNPLRFGGLCCTELSLYAWGFRAYDYFLNDTKPDWPALLDGKDGKTYSFVILEGEGLDPAVADFDFDALCDSLEHVLDLRDSGFESIGLFGMLFIETSESNRSELDRLLTSDLHEYLIPKK